MLARIPDKTEMIALVQRIIDMRYTEEELDDLLDLLARSTGCAAVSDLIFWPERELSAAEIIDAAMACPPIALGDGAA